MRQCKVEFSGLKFMRGNNKIHCAILLGNKGGKNPTLLWSVRMSAILHHKAADGGTAWALCTESSQYHNCSVLGHQVTPSQRLRGHQREPFLSKASFGDPAVRRRLAWPWAVISCFVVQQNFNRNPQ